MAEQQRQQADLETAGRRLDQVEEALERLESGSYGRCASCGGEISDEALATDPLAELCGECRAAVVPSDEEG